MENGQNPHVRQIGTTLTTRGLYAGVSNPSVPNTDSSPQSRASSVATPDPTPDQGAFSELETDFVAADPDSHLTQEERVRLHACQCICQLPVSTVGNGRALTFSSSTPAYQSWKQISTSLQWERIVTQYNAMPCPLSPPSWTGR